MVVQRRDTGGRSLLLLIVVSALILVTLDSRGSGVINTVRNATRNVVDPVESVVDSVVSPVTDLTSGGSLRERVERQDRRIAELEGRLRRRRAVGSAVGELERLLDLPTIEDATAVAARVVSGAPGDFERTVQINKGTNQGIRVGQPVVTGGGLVGKVTATASTRSTVTLLDNPGFGVGVRLEVSKERGIAEGRPGDREMRLTFLSNPRVEVSEGELLFTAAVLNGAFPPDVPVGRVLRIEREPGDFEPRIFLAPLVALDDVEFVKVLRWPEPAAQPANGNGA